MSYWLPPALPLPKRTKALAPAAGPIDLAASWYWSKRLALPTEGDVATLDETGLWMLRTVMSASFDRPGWMYAQTQPSRWKGRFGLGEWHASLPLVRIHPRFQLLHVPFIRDNGRGWYADRNERGERYLAVRQEGERFRVYPRAIVAPRDNRQPQRTLNPDAFAKLVDAWDAAFDALPTPARSRLEAISGVPTLAASVPDEPYAERMEDTHPFWIHAQHLAWTAMGFFRLSLPRPEQTYRQTYHWTVLSPSFKEETPFYQAGPLRVEMPYNGWFGAIADASMPTPSADVLDRLERARGVVETVLNRFAPFDTPLFFDTLQVSNHGGSRFEDKAWGQSMPLVGTGQHFPWLSSKDASHAPTLHTALHFASALPPDWMALFHELATPHLSS